MAARFEREDVAFQRALDQARRDKTDLDALDRSSWARPNIRAELIRAPGGGGKARWDLAVDWANEVAAPLTPSAPARQSGSQTCSSEMAAAIAGELGVGSDLTRPELTSRWRAFLWRNHPDRLPAHERERAHLRVAVANALYDRALRDMAKGR